VKILFVTKEIGDPATRYRVLPLQTRLAEYGIETTLCDNTDGVTGKVRLLSSAWGTDLVFIQRKLFTPWLILVLKKLCNKIVFDFDDAIFCKSNGEPSSTRMRRFQKTIESSDLVIAGNRYLMEQCGSASTVVAPTPVDEQSYPQKIKKDAAIVMVWVGSRSTRKYLEAYRDTFESIGSENPGVVLKVISDFEFTLENLKVKNVPWNKTTETAEIASSHIGIAPMIDNAWTKGKCALKIIQYMAAGLPVISSRVGANQEVVVQDETGLLVDSVEEWIAAVRRLSTSTADREKMGNEGRRRMKQHYSQQVVVESIIQNLKEHDLIR
jgi:glycosyltransferase involved in cell wall biosynthesis